MVTLFTIGIFIVTIKLFQLAFKAAWGITKAVLFALGLPILLVVLFVVGLVYLAFPLLLLALLAAFLVPLFKRH